MNKPKPTKKSPVSQMRMTKTLKPMPKMAYSKKLSDMPKKKK